MAIHRIFLASSVLMSLAGLAQLCAAEQVEVHLRSGDVVTGELISQDDTQVVIKTSSIGHSGKPMTMTAGYPMTAVERIAKVADPEETFTQRAATAANPADHVALATWCREHAMLDHAAEEALKALAVETENAAATALMTDLGWVLVDSRWVKEAEWLAKQGKVRYQGKVITYSEMEAIKAQQRQNQLLVDARKAVDDRTAGVAILDARLANSPKRPAQIDAEIAKDTAAIAAAKAIAQNLASDKAAVEAAQKNLDQARAAQNQNANANSAASNANISALFAALETAQKAYNAARREAGGADQTIANLTAAVARLNEEKAHLDKEKERLVAQRAEAQQELEKARAALAELMKPVAATAPAPPPAGAPAPPPAGAPAPPPASGAGRAPAPAGGGASGP